ncbi:M50 family metallopeptidase [Leptolyngbya sp. FACHB-261]|nr:M50 family metallopeptidase [Leptolyngbya sp. FACHB-261]
MFHPGEKPSDRMELIWLLGAGVLTFALWQMPYGNYILYPFTILATWFHEMGHGLMAVLLGGEFRQLQIFANGSGVAQHSGALFLGPLGRALVAAAGPMGPPVAGAGLIVASTQLRTARWALLILGSVLLLSGLIWVRSLFGLAMVASLGAGILWLGLKTSGWLQGFAVQFLGVQACISTYHQLDYLFMNQAVIGGQLMRSDSAQIAQQLLLPYWFWGLLMAAGSFLILLKSLRVAYRQQGQ